MTLISKEITDKCSFSLLNLKHLDHMHDHYVAYSQIELDDYAKLKGKSRIR